VFSELDGNFVTTMLRLANERDRLRVVSDQHGRPTYAGDLARVITALVIGRTRQTVSWGVYHLSGGNAVSWYQFAERIIADGYEHGLIEQRPRVDAIATADYPTRARRPMNSVLEPSDVLTQALETQPDWQLGLGQVMARLRHRKPK
jgi:dTDP-4-dehydrorhamnose reductase